MKFESAEFPSDALSVKRLRKIFPSHFDAGGQDLEPNAPFFSPLGADNPEHLVRLAGMISDERIVAVTAFFKEYERIHKADMITKDQYKTAALVKTDLENDYQYFKLADSPQTARMLIGLVELQGIEQARKAKNIFVQ